MSPGIRKNTAPAPTQPAPLMRALQGFAWRDRTVRRGDLLRATDPIVQAAPLNFVDAGASTEEEHQAWVALQPEIPDWGPSPILPRRLADEDAMIATGSYSGTVGSMLVAVAAGQRVARTDRLVELKPEWFRPATDAA
jgi:hypothetical protein